MTLRTRVAIGLGWTGASHWIGLLLATVTTMVVARFLVPADYAVVAAAGVLAGVVGVLQESGLGAAVVHHSGAGERAATTALVLNVAGGTLALVACLAATPWVARFFQIDAVGPLAVAFIPLWFRAWTNVPLARLQKALDFRRCALVEGAQMVAYPTLTIPLAVVGAGVWALVLGQAGAALIGAATAWSLGGWRPRRGDVDWAVGRALLRYGRPLVWSNVLGMVNDRIDNVATGRVLGAPALGVYAMAFRLAALPRTGFTFVVSRVLFPAMSAIQGDERRMRDGFVRALHWVGVLAMPASVGLALVAPELVRVALGPRWTDVVTPLRVLAVFGFLAPLAATTGDAFKATGRSNLIFRIGLLHSAVLWTGLALLTWRGTAAVALAVSAATLLSATVSFVCVLGPLRLGVAEVGRALASPAVGTATMAAAVIAARTLTVAGDAFRLVTLVGVGAAVYVIAMALLAPADARELAGALAAFRERRPGEARALARG
ncbi:MAG TPA: lipopolysaccharide biosynthesis protein [Candidatus Binatia bacterium]|nr:lipopolysaccharide biosynthesis protein [Candidatus Binatia bacterium]